MSAGAFSRAAAVAEELSIKQDARGEDDAVSNREVLNLFWRMDFACSHQVQLSWGSTVTAVGNS